jgi:hypothetical protein
MSHNVISICHTNMLQCLHCLHCLLTLLHTSHSLNEHTPAEQDHDSTCMDTSLQIFLAHHASRFLLVQGVRHTPPCTQQRGRAEHLEFDWGGSPPEAEEAAGVWAKRDETRRTYVKRYT